MKITNDASVLVYAEDAFSLKSREQFSLRAKTADGYIRYAETNICGVIDSSAKEKTVRDVLGIREDIPLYTSIKSFLDSHQKADILLIGIAPSGGHITDGLRGDIKLAIKSGMHIVSGMHYELNKDPEISQLAKDYAISLWDVRIPPDDLPVASCRAYAMKKPVLLTCAADAAIGKMTVGFELERQLGAKNIRGEMLATGQTSIMVKGKGISIDRVIGDFMPGAVEKLVMEADPLNRFLIIEGQGGLSHPGYAPVTLALIHGGMPSHAILIYRPQRKHSIGSKLIILPDIQKTMEMYRNAALPIRIPKFIGVAVHSKGLRDTEAGDVVKRVQNETGLPAEDMIRMPTGLLADAFAQVILDYEKRL